MLISLNLKEMTKVGRGPVISKIRFGYMVLLPLKTNPVESNQNTNVSSFYASVLSLF
jgi:hypothetical protein